MTVPTEILTPVEEQALSWLGWCTRENRHDAAARPRFAVEMEALCGLELAWGSPGVGYRLTPRGRSALVTFPAPPLECG